MDFAILHAIVTVLKMLAARVQQGFLQYNMLATHELAQIFQRCIKDGDLAIIDHREYLALFGCSQPVTAKQMWKHLLPNPTPEQSLLLNQGPLARRILGQWNQAKDTQQQHQIYRSLVDCLHEGTPFVRDAHADMLDRHL